MRSQVGSFPFLRTRDSYSGPQPARTSSRLRWSSAFNAPTCARCAVNDAASSARSFGLPIGSRRTFAIAASGPGHRRDDQPAARQVLDVVVAAGERVVVEQAQVQRGRRLYAQDAERLERLF